MNLRSCNLIIVEQEECSDTDGSDNDGLVDESGIYETSDSVLPTSIL